MKIEGAVTAMISEYPFNLILSELVQRSLEWPTYKWQRLIHHDISAWMDE